MLHRFTGGLDSCFIFITLANAVGNKHCSLMARLDRLLVIHDTNWCLQTLTKHRIYAEVSGQSRKIYIVS